MPLADFQQQVNDLVRDKDQVIAVSARDAAIATAVLRYSGDRPRFVVVDQAGNGSMLLDLPAGWQADFSRLLVLEYPIGQFPAAVVDPAAYYLYQAPSGIKIQLPVVVAPSDSVRVSYTQRHTVEAVTDTVPLVDRAPVCCLAASILCGQLANYYATDSEPTIAADSVDHRRKSDVFRSRERELAAKYFTDLGLEESRTTAAGTVVNLHDSDSLGGDRLFHRRRYR